MTVELGRLGELLDSSENSNQQFNVLVDGREGKGSILQHPLFESILQKGKAQNVQLPSEFSTADYQVALKGWNHKTDYVDPLSKHESGKQFRSQWIAAKKKVQLDAARSGTRVGGDVIDTGLIVLVQENYEHATKPIENLSAQLRRVGISAFSVIVAGVLTLWLLVARSIRDPNERIRRKGGLRQPQSSLHSMATIELPSKLRRDP